MDAVGLYLVHSLTADSPLFGDRALLAELAGLAASGVRVGCSTSGPRQADVLRRALDLRVAGEPAFTAVQSTWNVLEPSAGPALADAHDAGAHVLVKETLANGRLADRDAIAAVLAQPWADIVLLGPWTPAGSRPTCAPCTPSPPWPIRSTPGPTGPRAQRGPGTDRPASGAAAPARPARTATAVVQPPVELGERQPAGCCDLGRVRRDRAVPADRVDEGVKAQPGAGPGGA